MATSGTVGQTQLTVIDLIERATRRCGRLPGSLTSEDLAVAKDNLFLGMASLVNKGIPLWTIEKIVLGVHVNQYLLPFPPATIDVRNVLYRYNVLPSGGVASSSSGGVAQYAFDQNTSTACTQSAPNGNISYNFGLQVLIPFVGFLNNQTGTLNPVYEWSNDGVTWTQLAQASYAGGQTGTFGSGTYSAGSWYWQDIAQPVAAQFFRLRETGGGTLNITELVFGQPAREITISRSNADDYQNLPYKNQQSGNGAVLQYWFDRQIQPQAWLWPASGYEFNTAVCWARRELQDVGSYLSNLEFPDRWLDPVINDLAARLCYELQGIDFKRIPLIEAKAAKTMADAWSEERDDSPFMIQPSIGCYTGRG
jgi:hypothetical protein